MVWDRRFELLTSRTPCVRATKLRQSQMFILYHKCDIMNVWLGVAQLVARDVWDVEVAGSSPVTQTIFI